MTDHNFPATSFASASALSSGRELTHDEIRDFQRRQRRATLTLWLLVIAVPVSAVLVAWGGTRERSLERTRYRLDGSKEVYSEYQGIKKHGRYVEYYANGNVRLTGAHEDDILTGRWAQFDWDGVRRADTGYLRGRAHGVWRVYDRKGALESEQTFEKGRTVGESYAFWPNGVIQSVTPHVDGRVHGVERTYHQNGVLSSEIEWRRGVSNGSATFYDETGAVAAHGVHVDGLRAGLWMERTVDGALSTQNWRDGQPVPDDDASL